MAEFVPPPPPVARLHLWQIQAVRDLLVVAAVIGVVWAGYAMRAVTVPLLIALVLAYLFEPLVSWLMRRWRISRPMAVSGLLCSLGVVLVVSLAILVPLVVSQTVRLVHDVRSGRFERLAERARQYVPVAYQDEFDQVVHWMMPSVELRFTVDQPSDPLEDALPIEGEPTTQAMIVEAPPSAFDALSEERIRQIVQSELAAAEGRAQSVNPLVRLARGGTEAVLNVLGAIVRLGLLAFLIPFYFFFFSVSFPAVQEFGANLLPQSSRPWALELIRKMDRAVAGFVRGRIVICVIMGVMLAIGWWACGVPYSIVVGFVTGVFSLVPYLGGVGLPLAIGLLAFDELGSGTPAEAQMPVWAILLWPTVVFTIVQAFESYVLTPMIAGKATNLDPVTILVAVLAGGSVGGVYGMILAIPVAACLKILVTDVLLPKVRAWTRGEARDFLPISPQ